MAKGKDFLPPPIYSGRVRQNTKKKTNAFTIITETQRHCYVRTRKGRLPEVKVK